MATFEQLAARVPGGIPEADRPRAEAALADAELAVRAEAGLGDEDALPAVLVPLVLRVARREFTNPLGLASETVGDYTWRADGRGVGTSLTEDERAEVARLVGRPDIVSVPIRQCWTPDEVRRITALRPDEVRIWSDGGASW